MLRETVRTLEESFISQLDGKQQTIMTLTGKVDRVRSYYGEESPNHRADDSECVLEIRVVALMFREKPALALIFHDITERNTIAMLEDNNNYKNRLLASVSHELRTPLNASINFIQSAIDDDKLPEDIRENFLLPSLASNRLLLSLINDILDFSQMSANKLRLVYETADVRKTVDDCVGLLKIQATRKGISLGVEYDIETESSELCTDHNRLKQIILNLLSNAIKFTLEGGVTVKVKLMSSPEYKKLLHVQVSDTGIGISEENRQKLFQAFVKIDLGKRLSINSSGVGLGLMISNNLVQMLGPMDGEENNAIRVKSELNKGSTFEFWIRDQEEPPLLAFLTLKKSKSSLPEDHASMMNEHSDVMQIPHQSFLKFDLAKRSFCNPFSSEFSGLISPTKRSDICNCPAILVVDDDVFNITVLQTILDTLGYPSHSAYNGQQAIQKVLDRQGKSCGFGCSGQYKLIFMDCNMPVLDGFDATRELRELMKQKRVSEIPIIGCTALVQPHERERAINAGMSEVCNKPLDREKINNIIKKF